MNDKKAESQKYGGLTLEKKPLIDCQFTTHGQQKTIDF